MGACFTEDMIPAEKITATIDKFFKEMAIRSTLGVLRSKYHCEVFLHYLIS